MFICWLWQQDGAVWAFSALSLLSLSCRRHERRTRLQVGAVALLMTDGRRGMKGLMRGAVPLSPRLPLATSMRLPSLSGARLQGAGTARMQMSALSFWSLLPLMLLCSDDDDVCSNWCSQCANSC